MSRFVNYGTDNVNDGERPSTSTGRPPRCASRDTASSSASHNRTCDKESRGQIIRQESRDSTESKRRARSPETPHQAKSTLSRKGGDSSSTLSRHQIDFTSAFPGSDVVFKVQGKRVHAVSAVLKVASHEFKELIEQHGSVVDLRTTAIEHADFCELMEMLHPIAGKTKQVNSDNVYRLLPLIRLFDMGALQDECEDFLTKLTPELRQLAIASEYNFDQLEERVITWAATKTLKALEKDPDWGLVTTRQRRHILEKLVRKYELDIGKGGTDISTETAERNSTERTDIGNNEQVLQTILEENENLQRKLDHLKSRDGHMEQLEREFQKLKLHGEEVYKKYERYKKTVKQIQDIIQGKVQTKSLQLHCASKAMEQHYSGTEDKCATCRSYMVTQIKQLLSPE